MPNATQPATATLQVPFHARVAFTGAQTDTQPDAIDPAVTGSDADLGTAASGSQWAITNFTLTLTGACTVSIANETGGGGTTKMVWGPHTFPAAGVYDKVFPTGLMCGSGKGIYLTTSANNGVFEVFGYRVPVRVATS